VKSTESVPKNENVTIEKRRNDLELRIAELDYKGKSYSNAELEKYLKSKGYETSPSTTLRDLEELRNGSTFVRDVGMNYSYHMEKSNKTFERLQRMAQKIHDTKWTQSKQVKKQVLGRNNEIIDITETITTKEIASPKLQAIKIIADIEQMKIEMKNGKTLDYSATMWIKKEKDLQQQIKELQLQVNDLSKIKEKKVLVKSEK